MPDLGPITIDPTEKFPHLTRAPIVEAVIDLRGRVLTAWEEPAVLEAIKARLPDYPTRKSMRGVVIPFTFTIAGPQAGAAVPRAFPTPPTPEDRGWIGLRVESIDGRNIATFTRDGFSFSRLAPYQDWATFSGDAMRLWGIHRDIARAEDVQRLGVRCINQIEVPVTDLRFDEYLRGFASPQAELPTAGFLHQDLLAVPGHPYAVNVTRTMQTPEKPEAATLSILIDVDVFCTEAFPADGGTISKRLAEMHWLRNRAFFGSITGKTEDLFR